MDQVHRRAQGQGRAVRVGLDLQPGGLLLQVGVARRPQGAQRRRGLAELEGLHLGLVLGQQARDLLAELRLRLARRGTRRDLLAEALLGEGQDAVDEVAEGVGQVLVHRGGEVLPGEGRVVRLGGVGDQEVAPVVRGQDVQRVVGEDTALLGRGELPAVVRQPVEGLDVVDLLPRLAHAQLGGREHDGVEGDVVLRHELRVADRVLAGVRLVPPGLPVAVLRVCVSRGVRPLLRRPDVLDRRVEPDVEDLALRRQLRPGVGRDRDAPVQVTGDRPVVQALRQPLAGDGGGELRPLVLVARHPLRDLALELRLEEEEVLGLADLQVRRAGDRAARVDQVGRVQHAGAVLALVAAGLVVAAVGAGALHIAVREEAAVRRGVHLADRALLDEAVLVQAAREVLGDLAVLRAGAAAEVVEGQLEAVVHRLLRVVRLCAELVDRQTLLLGRQLGRGAVLVRRADVEDVVAALAEVPGVHVRREHGPHHVAQVLDPVDVRKGAGDEVSSHRGCSQVVTCRYVG